MDKKNATLQDYLDDYEMKGEITVIENGQVVGFKNEE